MLYFPYWPRLVLPWFVTTSLPRFAMRSVGLALLALCAVSAAPGPKLVFRTDDRQHTCNLLMTGASKLELQDDSGNSGCDLHVGGVSLATELRELQTRQRQFETSQSAMQRTLTDLGVGVSDLKSAHQRLQADVSSVQAQLGSVARRDVALRGHLQ